MIEKLGSLETQEGYLMSDQTSFTFYVYTAGQYRVTCERSYPGRPDLTSTASATVNVSNCPDLLTLIGDNNSFNPIDCQGFWEGDYLLTFQNDTTKHAFAHLGNDILYATLEKDDAFVPRSVLMANHLFEEYALCFAETDPRALPVTLATFDARPSEGKAVLTWTTANETNSAWFEIMRSPDGHDWQVTDKVVARNEGETVSNYLFVDSLPLPGISYYRLKMMDSDSSYAYSRIRRVQFADAQITIFPNPIDDRMSLRLSVDESNVKEITVSDLAGRIVYRADSVAHLHDAKKLMTGRYIVKIRMKDGSEINRVILKR
ncbi:T9SS type A sorting domain-containing protein [Dyadobacter fermentans]|uniref:T9SS type A sorting domain-containing protein n=1 Tax=Dyadobacter fermentans TaxID=94254 RepID=UPI00019B6C1C|nr:T9SS type A sorting domain-containing protein [Dyadobacter fermentans]